MCNYLPLLQKLPAALVIRKVKVTKHSSFKGRVLSRTTLCAFSSFGKGKIIAHNLGTKIGLISHIYFGIFCTGWEGASDHQQCWSQFLAGFIHPVRWHPPDDGRHYALWSSGRDRAACNSGWLPIKASLKRDSLQSSSSSQLRAEPLHPLSIEDTKMEALVAI